MNTCQKVFTCLCCHNCACQVAMCIDMWQGYEACCLADLECAHCCWRVCAPICHSTQCGNVGEAMPHCTKGIKYCLYSCALCCVGPLDGCYACVKYICDVCGTGVTGFGDMLKNTKWLNEKVRNAFELTNGSEPEKTFGEYRP
jgi:hypothetical protein